MPRHERLEQLLDARRVARGLCLRDRLLAEEVDGRRLAATPEALEARQRVGRGRAGDELSRHAEDVPARGGGRDLRAEGDMLGDLEPETERARDGHTSEVLAQVPEDVRVVAAGGEDVDEPEELRLEARMGHRPVEHALAPPAEVEEVRALGCTGGRDLARERLDLVLEALVVGRLVGAERHRRHYRPG